MKEYREQLKGGGGKKAQRVRRYSPYMSHNNSEELSIVFEAMFANKLRANVCADNEADGNVMDTLTRKELEVTGTDITVQKLNRPPVFEMAAALANGECAFLNSKITVSVYIEQKIRHGAVLVSRNVIWLVTEQSVAERLLGRLLLEALGLNTRELLAAAADRFARSIYSERLVGTFANKGDGRVSRIMEGVLYPHGGED